ncbi:MAG: hypothetical protein R3E73_14195 [Porticoccaceae bacterium]|nr:hypothetical protein [Pseudomonadales bacterium]MCP5170908.1 hypothetical protein [Pseudomonadales bacterium]MCP5301852.1 hypothetical protein [Pseudomonadales bacterium]
MIGKLVSKSIDLATLPARMTIRGSIRVLKATDLLPGGMEQFQEDMKSLLRELDADFDRDVEDMTEQERETIAIQEIQRAEYHISGALISMLRLVRLATADQHRIIEHPAIDNRIR